MDEIKDKDFQTRNDAFANDLREALRRREDKRPEVEVPEDFLVNVMQQVGSEKTRTASKAWRIALTSLALAACTITAVLLVLPKGDEQRPICNSLIVSKEQTPSQSPSDLQLVTTEKTIDSKPATKKYTEERYVTWKQSVQAQNVDSLDYYIAKIERELTKVDENLYIEKMQRVIHADERLQRLVNKFIVHELKKDSQPHEAILIYNVKKEEVYEELHEQ